MRRSFARVLAGVAVLGTLLVMRSATVIAAQPVELRLEGGTVRKGEVTATSPEDVAVRTDYGVVRVATARLTPESRAKVTAPRDHTGCESRVRELETRVDALEQENQDLRRRRAAAPAAPRALCPRRPRRPRAAPRCATR